MPHNIEKHPTRKGLYLGYGGGVWRITKQGKRWEARHGTALLFGAKLSDISRQLDAISAEETAHIAAQLRADRLAQLPNPYANA